MQFRGNDWLALTQEPALEPALPICDSHHHFWDMRGERAPYRRYLMHELADDVNSGHNVRSTVFVEARAMYRSSGPEEMRSVGEVEFVQGLAAASESGLYGPTRAAASIVGNADLSLGDRVEPVLEALQAASPKPLPRHPTLANLGPPSRVPGRVEAQHGRAYCRVRTSGQGRAFWHAWVCRSRRGCTSRSSRSSPTSPGPCPTCRSF